MTEQVAQPADIDKYRPDLPPLDVATGLLGSGIDCNKIALDSLREMRDAIHAVPTLRTEEQHYSTLINALEVSAAKQQSAIEKIREFQRIPGSN